MSPPWKQKKKQAEESSPSIPKSKIPKAEVDIPPPKRRIEGSDRGKKREALPPTRKKLPQPSKSRPPSLSSSGQSLQSREQGSRIPKSKVPKAKVGSSPPMRSSSRFERSPQKSDVLPPREKSRRKIRAIIPSDSGLKTGYAGNRKSKGKSPPVSRERPKIRTPRPLKHGLLRTDRNKITGSPIKRTKDFKEEKPRSSIPPELLSSKSRIESKTPRKTKTPLKSKTPGNN